MIDAPELALLHAARGAVWRRALADAGSVDALLGLDDTRLAAAGIDEAGIRRLRRPDPAVLDAMRRWLDGPGHALLVRGSPGYPERLAETDDPPLALWVDGARADLLGGPQVAIVGSRNATRAGRETARGLAEYLSRSGLTITSGLAVGIDAAGHEGALAGSSGTIAVLGCGIDVVYPRHNVRLAERIRADGAIVSEYPPGAPPLAHQFPERNRIIAGLAIGTVVVEAGRRSGALITARRAADYGREVFAVPGSIHNPVARGCHALIRQGAKLVEEGADVLVELAPQLDFAPKPPPAPTGAPGGSSLLDDETYRNLLNSLEFEPVPFAELADRSGLTTAELSSMLLLLELDGLVEALPGGRYCRVQTRSR
ncbi:MAG TPA: DNA-processing protein DprA [Gammaproteobacteria bacterium]